MRAPDVDICVTTYKRPALLERLLRALSRQDVRRTAWRVVVVDNDPEGSARATVEAVRDELGIEVLYLVEPEPGVAHARNRALDAVVAPRFAFLDDDETVGTDWLRLMLTVQDRFHADAVFAPVHGVLPPDAPDWAQDHPSFRRPRHATGTPVPFGGTGNVLVRTSALGDPAARFDTRFTLTGGEDTEFFDRLGRAGRRFVWCDEAMAQEDVPADRLQVRWVRRRAYRGGQSYARIFVARRSIVGKLAWLVRRTVHVLGGLVVLPLVRLVSKAVYVRLSTRLAAIVGELSTLAGDALIYEEYAGGRVRKG